MVHWVRLNIILFVQNFKFVAHHMRSVFLGGQHTSFNLTQQEYVAFVRQTVHTFLPERNENPELS